MAELTFLAQVTLTVGLVAAPIIFLVRFLGLDAIEVDRTGSGWPHGIQEEELQPWRFKPAG